MCIYTFSFSTNLRLATLTHRLPFLTPSFSQAIHCKMDECYVACWCQRTTCPNLLHNRKKQSNLNRRKRFFLINISKKNKNKKKYFDFVKVILKHLILISSKCVQPVQQTSRFHLIKNVFTSESLWSYLLPLTHPFHIWKGIAEQVQILMNLPITITQGRGRGAKPVQHMRKKREKRKKMGEDIFTY